MNEFPLHRLPIPDSRFQIPDFGFQISDSRSGIRNKLSLHKSELPRHENNPAKRPGLVSMIIQAAAARITIKLPVQDRIEPILSQRRFQIETILHPSPEAGIWNPESCKPIPNPLPTLRRHESFGLAAE